MMSRRRLLLVVALAALTCLTTPGLASQRQAAGPDVDVHVTVISDGPLKAFDTGVDVERNVVARKGLHVRVHGFFDREAPPSEVPAHEVTVEIQKHDLTAFGRFQDGDGFDFLWPPLDRICDRAFELC